MDLINNVELIGTVTDGSRPVNYINGTKAENAKTFRIATKRNSGTVDIATVYTTIDITEVKAGETVHITGKIQTAKNFKNGGRVLVFILADSIEKVPAETTNSNTIFISGTLGKGIAYRERQNGKRITSLMLETKSYLRNATSCFIPVICWQENADKAKVLREGEAVQVTGRLQSRTFTRFKKTDAGEPCTHSDSERGKREQRTVYEVSVFKIKRQNEKPKHKS